MADSKTTPSQPTPEDTLTALINAAAAVDRTHRDFRFHSRKPAIRAAEKFVAKKAFSPRLRAALQKLLDVLMPRRLTPQESREYAAAQGVFWTDQGATAAFWGASAKMELFERITRSLVDENRQIDRLRQLLSACPQSPMTLAFETAEPWAHAAKSDIDALPKALLAKWPALLAHIQSAKGSKPSAKWLKNAQILVDAFDRKRFHELLTRWLPLTAQNRTDSPPANAHGPDQKLLLSRHSEVTLKGLAWTATLFDDPDVIASLGDLGEACWRKIYWYGPRSTLVGNAVLWALSEIAARGQTHAVAQLTRINSKLKHASARARSDRAISHVAAATGQSREDLEEIALPTFGLDANGTRTQPIADFTCIIAITPDFDAALSITDANCKVRKSIPADLKSNPEFKALQKTLKELRALLPAQRHRIESILRLPDRSWSFNEWKKRYLDHPLLAPLTRRLIWCFTTPNPALSESANQCVPIDLSGRRSAIPLANQILNSSDSPFGAPHLAACRVSLWHPCADSAANVQAWRAFLDRHQITQPFKQAHREVYLLTDPERHTGTYSNRFAAHIIRQHQFNALCAQRAWKYKLQGSWDGANTPTLDIPALNLSVEFWVEQLGNGNDDSLTGSGVSLNLSTDQVRFCRLGGGQALPLDQIPPQVFSEIMRDIDLFVGVCSVANDPTWSDGGPEGRFRQYWHDTSFGDLSASAQTRKEVLSALLPRLAIAPQCSVSEKFLRVKGTKRTYKIHLGSANILMEPNDQYLCIVPNASARSSAPNLFLPFEGDNTLAIILSKAFLLAADHKITDPTILRQIT